MSDPITLLALVVTAVAGLCMAIAAALTAWKGWLELKRLEIAQAPPLEGAPPSPAARIELADLKERVRRLEAIASGSIQT